MHTIIDYSTLDLITKMIAYCFRKDWTIAGWLEHFIRFFKYSLLKKLSIRIWGFSIIDLFLANHKTIVDVSNFG